MNTLPQDPLIRKAFAMFACEPDGELDGAPWMFRDVGAFVAVMDTGPIVEMGKKPVELDMFGNPIAEKNRRGKC
jgi:hypothetical protein